MSQTTPQYYCIVRTLRRDFLLFLFWIEMHIAQSCNGMESNIKEMQGLWLQCKTSDAQHLLHTAALETGAFLSCHHMAVLVHIMPGRITRRHCFKMHVARFLLPAVRVLPHMALALLGTGSSFCWRHIAALAYITPRVCAGIALKRFFCAANCTRAV